MEFFLDENIPYSAKEVFKKFSLTALHVRDVNLTGAKDKDVFNYAVKNKLILVTKDLDFANILLYPEGSHHGIIILRLPKQFTAIQINNTISNFLNTTDLKEIPAAMIIVELGGYRIRKSNLR